LIVTVLDYGRGPSEGIGCLVVGDYADFVEIS
jgi:hypothetical protein